MNIKLTPQELLRYDRQINLDEIGYDGQLKLKKAKVLCVGAGGLAASALTALACAGVGKIGIVDFDYIDLSNIQRQFLFRTEDIGLKKVSRAKSHIEALNPELQIVAYDEKLDRSNAKHLIEQYDYVIDATDSYATRYLINDICFFLNKPLFYGSVSRFEGQATVFLKGKGCLRCLYKASPPPELMPNCTEAGVMGVVPMIIGTIQASELIKYIIDFGTSLSGRLLIYDAAKSKFKEFEVEKNKQCALCSKELSFEELPCNQTSLAQHTDQQLSQINVLDLAQFKKILQQGNEFQLIDVREKHERALISLGGLHIPLNSLTDNINNIRTDIPKIIYCKAGIRSKKAVEILKQHNFAEVFSIQGGIDAMISSLDNKTLNYLKTLK